MISFKIISQNLFQRLQKNQHNALSQIESLIRTNNQLVETVQQGKSNIAHAELQLQAALTKNQQLQQNQISLQNLLLKSADQLSAEIQKSKALNLLKNETTSDLNAVLKQKAVLSAQNSRLLKKIAVLEQGLVLQNKKILQGQIKEQQFHLTIQKLSEIINNSNLEKDQISQNLKEKNNEIRNLKHQLEERTNLVEKLASEYEVLKEQTQACQKQLETLKDSPIAKVEEKLKGKQIWINELTATINQLKQRCIRLQMGRPDNMHPITANRLISGQKYENPGDTQKKAIFHKSYNEQAQRLRYLNICRQFLQQFNKKLKKIHQQKKSIEQKYHCIKLKINDYQYNEFKYKDKLSLYLQKIQRYEKLTEKQQNQMEKLITEFDKELSDVIKTKQDEIKEKIQAEISKHLEKENGRGRLDESSLQVEKHDKKGQFGQIDQFQFEMLKKQIQFLKLELKKYKQSKRHYKIQKQKLEKQCQNSSNELRRYKYLIQQLWKQLDIKTNENQILKSNFVYSTGNSHKSNQYANSRRQNGEDLYENLSARLSARNQQIGKNSSSDHFQYQTSQIDTELMRKNQTYLNKLMFHKHQTMQQSPAGPQGEVNSGRFKRNQSDISSQSQDCSFKQSQSSSNNSPSNSFSSKNSYKSYGIKYLYTDNKHSTQNIPYKFILHKNSLQ